MDNQQAKAAMRTAIVRLSEMSSLAKEATQVELPAKFAIRLSKLTVEINSCELSLQRKLDSIVKEVLKAATTRKRLEEQIKKLRQEG